MAGAGKIIASGLSLNPELQASLVAFNFDFSLLKVNPPAEYVGVGSSLTKLRKHEAEDGTRHVTIRKLAALFADLVPSTKFLFKAYGRRATEICGSPSFNPASDPQFGPFVDHVGMDSTTVWAAATSGIEALAVHLLSCLLARIWAADEAVAVWVELVKEHKSRIEEQVKSGCELNSARVFASKLEVSRHQLVEWDASTRAWLSSADRVKEKEQTQLRLILSNVTLPISPAKGLYESVTQMWIRSMKFMEDLLDGKPFSVRNGDLLLGLSSWHMYPNLSIVTGHTKHVFQQDKLIPDSAIVTIGLLSKVQDEGSGVSWSLPLAHLRHYGRPITRTRHSGFGQSRVSFNDLLFVALGSIFRQWQQDDADFTTSMSLLELIVETLIHENKPVFTWLQTLSETCKRFQSLSDVEKPTARQLMRLGFRHGPSFIARDIDTPPAAFGLTNLRILLGICSTPDTRIKLLRLWAKIHLNENEQAIIRYFLPNSNIERYALVEKPSKKRKRSYEDGPVDDHPEHWVKRSIQEERLINVNENLRTPLDNPQSWSRTRDANGATANDQNDSPEEDIELGEWIQKDVLQNLLPVSSQTKEEDVSRNTLVNTPDFADDPTNLNKDGPHDGTRDRLWLENETSDFWFPFPAWTHGEDEEKLRPYRYVAGVIGLAAIYVPYNSKMTRSSSNSLTCRELSHFLRYRDKERELPLVSGTLASHIWRFLLETEHPKYVASLEALQMASQLYCHLPHAYVDLQVRMTPLHEALFFDPSVEKSVPQDKQRSVSFSAHLSCIAFFETGFINIGPDCFKDAMAVCYQDSMYVARQLLQDPSDQLHQCPVVRIVGNIGKPGFSILHPPVAPEVKPIDVNTSWQLAKYEDFNGRFEDSFSSTSLHLSFTGSVVPYGLADTGDIHRDVYFVETLIQAFDKGQWIADLDILKYASCVHHGWPERLMGPNGAIEAPMCSIDTWDELLEVPPRDAVFRARQNWMARLAAVTILAQQNRVCSIIPLSSKDMTDYKPGSSRRQMTINSQKIAAHDAEEALEDWESPSTTCEGQRHDDNFEAIFAAQVDSIGDSGSDAASLSDLDFDETDRQSHIQKEVTCQEQNVHRSWLEGSVPPLQQHDDSQKPWIVII